MIFLINFKKYDQKLKHLLYRVKLTTGLTRLAVAQSPQHTLSVLYAKTLRSLQKIPSDSAYRRYTEQIIKERAAAVSEVTIRLNPIYSVYSLVSYAPTGD